MTLPERPILLLHGLWLRSPSLLPLARRLRAAGFECQRFDYVTVGDTPERAAEQLCQQLRDAAPARVDLVAHSLGGMIALEALRRVPELGVHRVVCLGSPLRGSSTAAALARWRIGPTLLGRSADLLQNGLPDWQGRAEVGVIAGSRPLGLGRLIHRLPPPHDGTVRVAETELPGLADHLVLDTTHTGMLFSPAVARQVVAFLHDGRFAHAAPEASIRHGSPPRA